MNFPFHHSGTLQFKTHAILAGTLVAICVHLLLTSFGAGLTALLFKPSASGALVVFSISMAVTWTLSALVALWIGGWLAGRLGAPGDEDSGLLHGFLLWSITTVITFLLLAAGVGKSLNLAGQLAGGAGRMVAEVAPDLAHQPSAVIKEYSSELALDGKPLPPSAVREIATQLKNYLAEGDAGRTPQNRTALAQALSNHTKMSQEEVTRTVDEWTSSYDRTAAEVKAAADRASTVTGASALWTFLAFWVGAISASWGGKLGAVGFAKTSQATHTHSDREIPISHAH